MVIDKQEHHSQLSLQGGVGVIDHDIPNNVNNIVSRVGADNGVVATNGWGLDVSQHQVLAQSHCQVMHLMKSTYSLG